MPAAHIDDTKNIKTAIDRLTSQPLSRENDEKKNENKNSISLVELIFDGVKKKCTAHNNSFIQSDLNQWKINLFHFILHHVL